MNPMNEIQTAKYAHGWDRFNYVLYFRIKKLRRDEKMARLFAELKIALARFKCGENYKRPQYINQ